MKVRTVTVDLWGTLFIDTPASDNRYKARRLADFDVILRGEGKAFTMSRLARAYDDSGAYLGRIWAGNRDVPVADHARAILRALDRRLAEAARPDLIDALVQAYTRPALLVPPAIDTTAARAFQGLRECGVTLALVSNTMRTPGVVLRQLLDGAGLLQFFAHTVFSDEIGIRKPDPEIFRRALLGVAGDPATSVHVGDDGILDVEGGRAAGMRVVQVLNRGAVDPSRPPDRTITCLGELPAAIAALEA